MIKSTKLNIALSAMIACSVLVGCGHAQKSTSTTTTKPVASATTTSVAKKPEFTVAYSVYAGWMPYYLMVKNGTLKKWADKEGIVINARPMTYPASMDAYSAGDAEGKTGAQALAVASMDTLMSHAANGKDTTVVITGDYSDGNDALLARNGKTLKDLEGSTVMLMEKSVSEYVFRQCCDINGLNPAKVKFVNAPDDAIQNMFASTPKQNFVLSWNPMVHEMLKEKGVRRLFDSSKLKGQIQDLLVMDTATVKQHPEFARALTGAWYETMKLMTEGDAATKKAAIDYMAGQSGPGVTAIDLNEQLETTHMFYTPQNAVTFTESKELKDYVTRVHTFCSEHALLPPGSKPIGISFPDGTTEGDAKNVKLRYDTTFMKEAADGSL